MSIRSLKGGLLLLSLGLAALVGAPPVAAEDMKELGVPYLRARDDRAVGEVAGHAYGDAPRPSAPAVPYEGVSVLLLPYSAGLESGAMVEDSSGWRACRSANGCCWHGAKRRTRARLPGCDRRRQEGFAIFP